MMEWWCKIYIYIIYSIWKHRLHETDIRADQIDTQHSHAYNTEYRYNIWIINIIVRIIATRAPNGVGIV